MVITYITKRTIADSITMKKDGLPAKKEMQIPTGYGSS